MDLELLCEQTKFLPHTVSLEMLVVELAAWAEENAPDFEASHKHGASKQSRFIASAHISWRCVFLHHCYANQAHIL